MANDVNARLLIQIAANTVGLSKSLNTSAKEISSFTSGLTKAAGLVGVAFGTQQVISFAAEIAKLSGEAEGVRAAFDRLPDSRRLMEELKDATSDTVSELDLMKRTVQAANFGISLEALPQLLEFAAVRAQQTGQSVDYLVDSIITGIGRKSPLILDNLGISAVRLKEQFGGAALEAQNIGSVAEAVGRIAEQELSKMGEFSQNTSSQFQQLTAAWENFKVSLGSTETGIFNQLAKDATNLLKSFGSASDQADVLIGTFAKRISEGLDESSPAFDRFVEMLKSLREEAGTPFKINIKQLADEFELTEEQTNKLFEALNDVNGSLSAQEKVIRNLTKSAKDYFGGDNLKAADDYKNKIYEQILALQIEQSKIQEVSEFAEGATDEALENIAKEIKAQYSRIDVINEYIKTLNSVPVIPEPPTGIIDSITEQLKKLEEQKKASFSESEIAGFNARIDELKAKLETLNASRPLSNANLAGTLPTEVTLTGNDFVSAATGLQDVTRGIAQGFEPVFDTIINGYKNSTQAVTDFGIATGIQHESVTAQLAQQAQSLLALSDIAAGAFESATSGQQSFISALGDATLKIVDLFLKQALAAAIAKSIATPGVPFPIGLALAGVALGAVRGLFRKAVGTGGGGGSGSAGGGSVTTGTRATQTTSQSVRVEFGQASFKFNGRELEAALKAQQQLNGIIGG